MERKDYLVKKLSNEEKVYFKRIVMTAKNKYIEKNYDYINKTESIITDMIPTKEESVLDIILQKYQDEVVSAVEFEETLSDPKLYKIVKALSLKEKEVLFYLYKKHKSINDISQIMNIDRTNVWRIKTKAEGKIAEKIIKGEI